MRFSEAIAILEIMEGSHEVDGGLTTAYRRAMKKYHPDVTKLEPAFALEMSKLVNEAYAFLHEHMGKWSAKDKGEVNLADIMAEIYNKIKHLPHITIERVGVWLWVTIDSPPEFIMAKTDELKEILAKRNGLKAFRQGVGKELSACGFKFSGKHKKWSWHDVYDGPKFKKRGWDWDRITGTFGSDELDSKPRPAMA